MPRQDCENGQFDHYTQSGLCIEFDYYAQSCLGIESSLAESRHALMCRVSVNSYS